MRFHPLVAVLIAALGLAAATAVVAQSARPVPPPPPADRQLAPGLGELREAIERTRELVTAGEAQLGVVASAQNAWAEMALLSPAKGGPCGTDEAVSALRGASEVGRGLRDASQAARVQAGRTEWMAEQPSVEPLLEAGDRAAIKSLLSRSEGLAMAYEATAAWQQRHARRLQICPEPVTPATPPSEPTPSPTLTATPAPTGPVSDPTD